MDRKITIEPYIESVAILLSVGDHVSSVFLTRPVFGLAWSALSLGEEKLTASMKPAFIMYFMGILIKTL